MKRLLAFAASILVAGAAPAQTDIEKIQNANWFEREAAQGVVWKHYKFDNLFNSEQDIHVTSVDMNVAGNTVRVNYRTGGTRVPVTSFVTDHANTAAVVNGNFFDVTVGSPQYGEPLQHTRTDGVVRFQSRVGAHDEGAVVVDGSDDADTVLRPGSGNWNDRTEPHVLASNVPFWDNGVKYTLPTTNYYTVDRHPRTAVGKTADNKFLFVIVEGRRPGAAGMTLVEMQTLFEGLGATDALNMDGGGSSAMWVKNEPGNGIVNIPSDGFVRSVPTGLSIISTGAATPVDWDGRLTSVTANALTRTGEPYTVTAEYTNAGTQTWTSSNVAVVPSRAFGRNSVFVPDGQEATFFTMSPATVAPGQTATFTLNLEPPTVATDTVHTEHFALWHSTEGWFGTADHKLAFTVTVRPPLGGAPPLTVVQAGLGSLGPNNQWYVEDTGGWGNSTVGFTAEGVAAGSQRYCGAGTANRSASFRPVFDVAGTYKVEVAYPYSSNNITNVTYTVNHLNGTSSFSQNQNLSANCNTWNLLGNFEFGTGSTAKALGTHSVTVGNGAVTGNRFYAGAVRFDYVGPLASASDWQMFD